MRGRHGNGRHLPNVELQCRGLCAPPQPTKYHRTTSSQYLHHTNSASLDCISIFESLPSSKFTRGRDARRPGRAQPLRSLQRDAFYGTDTESYHRSRMQSAQNTRARAILVSNVSLEKAASGRDGDLEPLWGNLRRTSHSSFLCSCWPQTVTLVLQSASTSLM